MSNDLHGKSMVKHKIELWYLKKSKWYGYAIFDTYQLVWLETPTNPTLRIVDIAEAVKVVKQKNKDIIVVVDNTFMSSYFQVSRTSPYHL